MTDLLTITTTALLIVLGIIGLYISYLFYIKIPAQMAEERHRDPLIWVILCFCISPLWVIIILLFIGDSNE